MNFFPVKLNPSELEELNRRFPLSQGSNQIGQRAIEIVKTHFRRVHAGCSFVPAARGADVAIVLGGTEPNQYEVNGNCGFGDCLAAT